jgi:endonuclease-3
MVQGCPDKILKILKEEFRTTRFAFLPSDPFETLIATIISQNTSDKNTIRAFENLSNQFKITPEVLAKVGIYQIERCLKVAGLYRNKAS